MFTRLPKILYAAICENENIAEKPVYDFAEFSSRHLLEPLRKLYVFRSGL